MYRKIHRYNLLERLEKDIQHRAPTKDRKFVVEGPWKMFVRKQAGLNIYAVDGEWVRSNLSVIYGHGGHGYVHEFIPVDEIWVDINHYRNSNYDCGCSTRYKGGKVSKYFFNEVVRHEIAEFEAMEDGIPYWKAHQIACEKEKEDDEPPISTAKVDVPK